MLCCLVGVTIEYEYEYEYEKAWKNWQFSGNTTFSLAIAKRDMTSDRAE